MTRHKSSPIEIDLAKFRVIAAIVIPGMAFVAGLVVYQAWTEFYIFYNALKQNAPVINWSFTAFVMLIIVPMLVLMVPAMSMAAWTGDKFNPNQGSFLYALQVFAIKATLYGMISIFPISIISTIIFSLYSGYSHCPELTRRNSGMSLWVNDECFCFKPDYYINRNWPCKNINGKEVCIEIQGW